MVLAVIAACLALMMFVFSIFGGFIGGTHTFTEDPETISDRVSY